MSTPYLTDERKLLQESIHKFMKVECPREYVRACDEEKRYPYRQEYAGRRAEMERPFMIERVGTELRVGAVRI
jgi:hypothetical protein